MLLSCAALPATAAERLHRQAAAVHSPQGQALCEAGHVGTPRRDAVLPMLGSLISQGRSLTCSITGLRCLLCAGRGLQTCSQHPSRLDLLAAGSDCQLHVFSDCHMHVFSADGRLHSSTRRPSQCP